MATQNLLKNADLIGALEGHTVTKAVRTPDGKSLTLTLDTGDLVEIGIANVVVGMMPTEKVLTLRRLQKAQV